MSLTQKPYDPTQLIQSAQFRPKPNLIADVDLNRYMAIVQAASDLLATLVGPQINTIFAATSLSYNGTGQLVYDISYPNFTVVTRGLEFEIPAGELSGTTTTVNKPGVRVYLVAKKVLITFADDSVLSGINGTELAAPLPGADHYVYQNPRLAFVEFPNAVTLGTGEEVICPIMTVIPQAGGLPKLYTLSNNAYSDKLKQVLGNKFDGTSLVELDQYLTDYLYNSRGIPIGGLCMYDGPVVGDFDTTGLGIGSWIGWAMQNGANLQKDYRDKSPICYDDRTVDPSNGIWDPAYNAMGVTNTIGEKSHLITLAEFPDINYQAKRVRLATFSGANPDHNEVDLLGLGPTSTVPVSSLPNYKIFTNSPTAQAKMNVIQPSFVCAFVRRIS